MSISDSRQFPIILHLYKSEVTQTETPQVIQPSALILPTEDVETLIVSSHRTANSR